MEDELFDLPESISNENVLLTNSSHDIDQANDTIDVADIVTPLSNELHDFNMDAIGIDDNDIITKEFPLPVVPVKKESTIDLIANANQEIFEPSKKEIQQQIDNELTINKIEEKPMAQIVTDDNNDSLEFSSDDTDSESIDSELTQESESEPESDSEFEQEYYISIFEKEIPLDELDLYKVDLLQEIHEYREMNRQDVHIQRVYNVKSDVRSIEYQARYVREQSMSHEFVQYTSMLIVVLAIMVEKVVGMVDIPGFNLTNWHKQFFEKGLQASMHPILRKIYWQNKRKINKILNPHIELAFLITKSAIMYGLTNQLENQGILARTVQREMQAEANMEGINNIQFDSSNEESD